MRALVESNPAYSDITLIRVDWDKYRKSKLKKKLKIPRRSTLVMFKEGEEIARIVAQTNRGVIEAMFKAGIN